MLQHTSLLCTLLSFAAPNYAMLHPIKVSCNPLTYSMLHLTKLHRDLLGYTVYPSELRCIILTLRCMLLSYAVPCWAMLHPAKICCTLLKYAEPCKIPCMHPQRYAETYRDTLQSLICSAILVTLHIAEICCTTLYSIQFTILRYDSPNWAMLHLTKLSCDLWATVWCT